MKNILSSALLFAVLLIGAAGAAAAQPGDGLICPQVVLCDENGHWFAGVDPNGECAQQWHQFCTDRQQKAQATQFKWKRVKHYTRALSRCERKFGRVRPARNSRIHICSQYKEKLTKILKN